MLDNLTCNGVQKPLGIDDLYPQFSWNITSNVRGERQSAFQLVVASEKKSLGGNQGIVVRVWKKDGKITNWSSVPVLQ